MTTTMTMMMMCAAGSKQGECLLWALPEGTLGAGIHSRGWFVQQHEGLLAQHANGETQLTEKEKRVKIDWEMDDYSAGTKGK